MSSEIQSCQLVMLPVLLPSDIVCGNARRVGGRWMFSRCSPFHAEHEGLRYPFVEMFLLSFSFPPLCKKLHIPFYGIGQSQKNGNKQANPRERIIHDISLFLKMTVQTDAAVKVCCFVVMAWEALSGLKLPQIFLRRSFLLRSKMLNFYSLLASMRSNLWNKPY